MEELNEKIQHLSFYNKMKNLKSMFGTGTIFVKDSNGVFKIHGEHMPQWALDIMKKNLDNAIELSAKQIDSIVDDKFDNYLNDVSDIANSRLANTHVSAKKR